MKSRKSNIEDIIKKGDKLQGGERENIKGSKNQGKLCSFKGKSQKSLEKHVDSEHESNVMWDIC